MSHDAENRLHPTGRLIPAGLDEPMVRTVVEAFYARARADELIGPIFNRVVPPDHWPAHIATISDFWSSLLLGTGRYMGRPMPKHFAIPELGDIHFARWLRLFRQTAEELTPPHVAALFVERAETIGNNFRIRLAQFRGEDPGQLKRMRAGVEPGVWSPPE